MNRFPVLERLVVQGYRLYPDNDDYAGIDFKFETGISVLAGINGLGKTTLINLIFRLLVGPYDLPKDAGVGRFGSAAKANVVGWPGRQSFFSQRVADKAKTATATLEFRIGDRQFYVKRALSNLRLLEWRCDAGQTVPHQIHRHTDRSRTCSEASAGHSSFG